MLKLFALLLLVSCQFETSNTPALGECVLRNGRTHPLEIVEVLKNGFILEYWDKRYDESKQSYVFDLVRLYRGKTLVETEYKIIDCEAQDTSLESVEL